MQGGRGKSFNPLDDAFALDVNTHSLRRLPDITAAREVARAAVVDCKPAVIGGVTTEEIYLTSIETFNGSWTLHEMALENVRGGFGLV